MINYLELSKTEKINLIKELYVVQNKSFADIANLCGTYANKIRRDAKLFKIPIRNKSEAQKNALSTGKHTHPTKGKERSVQTKERIGHSVMVSWQELDQSELNNRKQKAKQNWDKLSPDTKNNMQKAATDAVRVSSKIGSKLEKFILEKLLKSGYSVEFHKEQTLVNTKLQIDLFLPTLNIAIEIDGPSHFAPVWGEESLKRNKNYDNKKQGLIIGKGWHLIRIKQTKDFSKTRASLVYENLQTTIKKLSTSKTATSITIED